MLSRPPPWLVKLMVDGKGSCPVWDFVLGQSPPDAAKIVRKMEHVANYRRQDLRRPMVDTVVGAIKELRVDKQLRVLFSCEDDRGVMLMLAATRKKNGDIDPKVVQAAVERREQWLREGSSASLSDLKQELNDN